jgi:hypothetical protein
MTMGINLSDVPVISAIVHAIASKPRGSALGANLSDFSSNINVIVSSANNNVFVSQLFSVNNTWSKLFFPWQGTFRGIEGIPRRLTF